MKRFFIKHSLLITIAFAVITVFSTGILNVAQTLAASTASITVTNTPQFLSMTNNVSTYNFNATGAAHAGVLPSTTYYSNPGGQTTAPSSTVVDGECAFQITDASSVAIDIVFTASNMATGSDNSTNGNTGTAGATSYGAYTYVSGVLLSSKVVCQSSASATGISNLGASATKYWGLQINEQTGAWTGATPATFTLLATASAH